MTATLPSGSDLHDLLLLLSERIVDPLDVIVGELLDLVRPDAMLVLGDFSVLFHFLEVLHAIAAHIAYRDAGLLGVFVADLAQLLAALLAQLRDGNAHELAVACRVEAEAGVADAPLDRRYQATIPDLD